MTGTRASFGVPALGVPALVGCLILLNVITSPAVLAQETDSANHSPTAVLHFDVPTQSLAGALDAYGRITGLSVFVKSALLDGRASAPLQGDYSPSEGLQRMLSGTGLQMIFTEADGVAIVPAPVSAPAEAVAAQPPPTMPAMMIPSSAIGGVVIGDDDYHWYAAQIQARLTDRLCASREARPGTYRALVQLRVGDSGAVVASRLVESTGLPARDTAIEEALRGIVLDAPPPPSLQQPVTILLHPLGNGVVDVCPLAGSQG